MTTPDTKTPPKAINTALYWVFSKEKGIIVPICTIAGPINIDPKMGSVDFSSMSSGKIPVHVKIKKLTITVSNIGTLARVIIDNHSPKAIKAKISTVAINGLLNTFTPPLLNSEIILNIMLSNISPLKSFVNELFRNFKPLKLWIIIKSTTVIGHIKFKYFYKSFKVFQNKYK